jgi:hypothetical protein
MTRDITVTIDEGQRQMLLLALAKLSIERPGWHWTLGELAALFSTAPSIQDGRELFEQFRDIHRATDAVDPHAADPGMPTPREKNLS